VRQRRVRAVDGEAAQGSGLVADSDKLPQAAIDGKPVPASGIARSLTRAVLQLIDRECGFHGF